MEFYKYCYNHVLFIESCSDWNTKVQAGPGLVNVVWSRPDVKSNYTYYLVYTTSTNDTITIQTIKTAYTVNTLSPSSTVKVTVIAVPDVSGLQSQACTKTAKVKPGNVT